MNEAEKKRHAACQQKIEALSKRAEPLRGLDDDDPRNEELAEIIDEINSLRAEQDKLSRDAAMRVAEGHVPEQRGKKTAE